MNLSNLSNESKKVMVLSCEDEAQLILDDIFGDDYDGQNHCVQIVCDDEGIANDPDTLGEEWDDMIINNEDRLSELYKEYMNDNFVYQEESES